MVFLSNGILSEIKNRHFSKSQEKIARYIEQDDKHAAFMTAAKLAKTVGVSEATVVRFANALGFAGYPEFQKQLRRETKVQLTAVDRIEIASESISENEIISKVLKSDMDKIEKTMGQLDRDGFNKAVDALFRAKHIYTVGVRSSASLAMFAGFYFNLLFKNSKVITQAGAEDIIEQFFHVGKGDVVVGISFPRYSNGIVRALEYAKSRGAFIIAVTDGPASPISGYADCCLYAPSDLDSFADSLVAPMSILNALIFTIGYKCRREAKETFEQLEMIWKDYDVYDSE